MLWLMLPLVPMALVIGAATFMSVLALRYRNGAE